MGGRGGGGEGCACAGVGGQGASQASHLGGGGQAGHRLDRSREARQGVEDRVTLMRGQAGLWVQWARGCEAGGVRSRGLGFILQGVAMGACCMASTPFPLHSRPTHLPTPDPPTWARRPVAARVPHGTDPPAGSLAPSPPAPVPPPSPHCLPVSLQAHTREASELAGTHKRGHTVVRKGKPWNLDLHNNKTLEPGPS